MRAGQFVVVTLLVISLIGNVLLLVERFEKRFYQMGVQAGAKQVTDRVMSDIQKNGRLNVQLPDGRKMVLEAIPSRPPVKVEAIPAEKP